MKKILLLAVTALAAALSCSRIQPAETIEVNVQGSCGNMPGIVQMPQMKKGAKVPMVIIYHGLTGHKDEAHLKALADRLQENGVASIRCDFNGHGDADGEFMDMTLANELEDALAIFDYVCALRWVDKDRIALSGHSQGGAIAGMAAGELGVGKVCCLALLAPAPCIHDFAVSGSMFGIEYDPSDPPEFLDFWAGTRLGRRYLEVARDLDIIALTARYEGPAQVIIGSSDGRSLFASAMKYSPAMKDCSDVVLEGLRHCFDPDIDAAAEAAVAFLMPHLK